MIPKISEGSGGTYRLIKYLYGPGDANEHTGQHMVASWNGFAPDPGFNATREALTKLANQLDLPVKALAREQRPKTTVWHCSVRADPGDRHLTDTEWADIARRMVAAAGIAPEGDTKACRWVAVRHAPDHIHIAATLVRQDGRTARRNFDRKAVQAEARAIEKDYGLRQLNPGDGTAAKRLTSAEHFKAQRTGRERTARETLREAVRQAVAGAATEEEFFARLRQAGVRVEKRIAPSGDTLGYKVALPGDRNRDNQPVWFSGSKLAPDLSLPKIRKRLSASNIDEPPTADTRPEQALRQATHTVEAALAALDGADDERASAQLTDTGEILDALAQSTAGPARTELQQAARAFERATRSHILAAEADQRALRKAAREILYAGPAFGRGEDGAATAMIIDVLLLLAVAATRWHSARGHTQQATASRQAAQHLRAAYRVASAEPMDRMREHAQRLPKPTRDRHLRTIQAVLPEHSRRMQDEPGREALTATLDQAERAGHDPAALLKQAAAMRELDTADNLNDVLTWRMHRLGNLAIPAKSPQPPANRQTAPATPTAPVSTRTMPPPSPATRPRGR
ncbi:relaxase/mobilization nuclease domain-containing protein [Streptantibioticus ferralitis]|uniref:Relaxase/mobilization nuclease domain-containing protein n=1 Tax=Streptantibioticus ferralitis TaxID=236510 RepID=A0ABT5Z450_9ACTN|nr:relaxase/mobilization nuclease domain-containing protein [Streptantibioticus ferralitis]MDF2258606.1 relaxase/mobilization nuclease domain-containing protein [Streptantibioticus ferralitis]